MVRVAVDLSDEAEKHHEWDAGLSHYTTHIHVLTLIHI